MEGFSSPTLRAQLALVEGPGVTSSGAAAVLAELAAMVGFISMELAGHFVGTVDPSDALFEAMVARQAATLCLH